jgi:hypothetical protein
MKGTNFGDIEAVGDFERDTPELNFTRLQGIQKSEVSSSSHFWYF